MKYHIYKTRNCVWNRWIVEIPGMGHIEVHTYSEALFFVALLLTINWGTCPDCGGNGWVMELLFSEDATCDLCKGCGIVPI